MTDNQAGPNEPVSSQPASDPFTRTEAIVRWVFWIAVAAVIVWVFADLLIRH